MDTPASAQAPPSHPIEIQVGFDVVLRFPAPTPLIVTLGVHDSRAADLLEPDLLQVEPPVPLHPYVDSYGNHCQRLVAPAGPLRLFGHGVVADSGRPDPVLPALEQRPVPELPEETLLFLLSSRFCESDLLSPVAWSRFEGGPAAGGGCRRSATSSTSMCASTTTAPARRNRRSRPSRAGRGCAVTSPTWPSPSAAA